MNARKRLSALILASALLLALCACHKQPLEGSQVTVEGIVVDRAMAKVEEDDRKSRAYLCIIPEGADMEDGEAWQLFWQADGREDAIPDDIALGDLVRVEGAIEEDTDLPIALSVEKLN